MLLKMLTSVTIQLYIYVLKKIYIYSTCISETFLISTFPFIFYQRKKYSICITIFCVISGAGTSYPSGALEFIPGFYWGSFYSIFSFMCMFCRSLFVLLYFFFWPLCCLFFFDIRILITPLVSSSSSYLNVKQIKSILKLALNTNQSINQIYTI